MTIIGPSLTLTGEVITEQDLTVEGRVKGYIVLRGGVLTVADGGHVAADIRGVRVVVDGTVEGSITASERIELRPTAIVTGSLSANQVVLSDGARFNGRIDMDRRTIAAKIAQFKAEQRVNG
jgi:cytoskeletal protein CcmA (bactofilin family)